MGPYGPHMGSYGPTWAHMDSMGPYGAHMGPHGPIWVHGPIWALWYFNYYMYGMMEAANEGAYRANGKSVGFGISLPFETGLNPYVTPELGFEFHYFFTRKFWMAYKCMGLVVSPGGYGTADELFEILTLMQTGKIKRNLPVILFGEEYWSQVLNFEAMEDPW